MPIDVGIFSGGDWVWDYELKAFRRVKPGGIVPTPDTRIPVSFSGSDPYLSLRAILDDVLDQASIGKGKDRHAREGENWDEQVWSQITHLLGNAGAGFLLGQAVKKIVESLRLDPNRAETELLGAMHYLAMRIHQIREARDK